MSVDLEHTKSVAELGLMLDPLLQAGRTATLDESAATITVALADDEGRTRTLTISMVPFGEPGESSLRLVRFDARLPFGPEEGTEADVVTALGVLSAYLAVGAFVRTDDGALHLRYTLATDAASLVADDVLVELVELLDFEQEHYGDYLEGICTDQVAVEVLPQLIAAAGD